MLWSIVLLFIYFEIAWILLMLVPLPSNSVRGLLVRLFKFLDSSKHVMLGVKITLALMSLLFLDALRTINHLDEESNVKHHQLHVQLRLFRNQRNAYMSGFALFLMFVAWRLQHITMRFHETRADLKKLKAASGVPTSPETPKKVA